MPDVPSIRRLTLANLDDNALLELAKHGEDLLVERKRQPPTPPQFGAAVGSFANTIGGWVLVGIDDKGDVHGWKPPGRADVQSHLGALLRAEVDPLPPFVAGMRELDGKPIAVVRVFPSADAPHIVRGTGAVYLRSSKGKEPVDDHRTLLELARRGSEAERRAAERLREPGDGSIAGLIYQDDPEMPEERHMLRASPLTVTPALAEWPWIRSAADACTNLVASLLPPAGHRQPSGPWVEHVGPTTVATGRLELGIVGGCTTVSTIATTDGLLGLERVFRRSDGHPSVVLIQTLLDEQLRPLAHALIDMLESAEAIGRALVTYSLHLGDQGQIAGGRRMLTDVHATSEITIPAGDTEVDELAHRWYRQIQRELGMPAYERED